MTNKLLVALLILMNLMLGFIIINDKLNIDFSHLITRTNPDSAEYTAPRQKPTHVDDDDSSSEVASSSLIESLPFKPKQETYSRLDLTRVKNFGILLSKVTIDKVKKSSYQMLIINEADQNSKMFMADDIKKMKEGKILLADISIGIAEKYRWYWKRQWNNIKPEFLGDKINDSLVYVKQWWHPEWREITERMIDRAIEAGYDGIVLSGVDVYIDLGASLKLRDKMTEYVMEISHYAKKKKPSFLVLPKNGERLGRNKDYARTVDGIIKEDLIYSSLSNGQSGPKNPLIQVARSMDDLNQFKLQEKPAFIIEYVSSSAWKSAKQLIKNNGYIGYSAPARSPNKIREDVW